MVGERQHHLGLPEILGQTDRVGAKSPNFSTYWLVVHQLILIESPLRAFH